MFTDSTVGDLMTKDLFLVEQNQKLARADEIMRTQRVRHVLVVDEEGDLQGVLSQRDLFHGGLLRALGFGAHAKDQALDSLLVKEAMKTDVITTGPEASLENAARLTGIKVWAVLLFVYAFSGLAAGLGGVMSAARLFAANGLQLGQSYELDAIAAVILGGTSFVGGIGSIWGTLIGALIIAILTNGLILVGVSDIWQFIIKGLVIIGAVALDRYRLKGSART